MSLIESLFVFPLLAAASLLICTTLTALKINDYRPIGQFCCQCENPFRLSFKLNLSFITANCTHQPYKHVVQFRCIYAKPLLNLIDFGVSCLLMGSCDLATTFTGTPYYMSPEAFGHKGYDSKSDIW